MTKPKLNKVASAAQSQAQQPEKKFLKKLEILSAQDVITKELYIPEWDGWITIKTITAAERDNYQIKMFREQMQLKQQLINQGAKGDVAALVQSKIDSSMSATLLKAAIVNPDGSQMFSDADIAALAQKNAEVVDRIIVEIKKLNAISPSDVEELAGELAQEQNSAS